MRPRSNTTVDNRRRLVTLSTCLPNQNELDFNHQPTLYVSWMKRYYFYYLGAVVAPASIFSFSQSYQITISLEIILLSLYLFVDIRIIIIKIKQKKTRRKKRRKKGDVFITFFFKYFI